MRKGAFVLTSGTMRKQWQIAGPHFPGWEISHLKGSPAGPERLYASQYSALVGQLIQHSNDDGKTWDRVGNKVRYESLSIESANQMSPVITGNPRNKDFWRARVVRMHYFRTELTFVRSSTAQARDAACCFTSSKKISS